MSVQAKFLTEKMGKGMGIVEDLFFLGGFSRSSASREAANKYC